jgi:hypothetical protein
MSTVGCGWDRCKDPLRKNAMPAICSHSPDVEQLLVQCFQMSRLVICAIKHLQLMGVNSNDE